MVSSCGGRRAALESVGLRSLPGGCDDLPRATERDDRGPTGSLRDTSVVGRGCDRHSGLVWRDRVHWADSAKEVVNLDAHAVSVRRRGAGSLALRAEQRRRPGWSCRVRHAGLGAGYQRRPRGPGSSSGNWRLAFLALPHVAARRLTWACTRRAPPAGDAPR